MKNIDRLKSKLEIFDEILSERRMHYTVYLFGAGLGIYHLQEDYRMSSDVDYMSQDEIDDEDFHAIHVFSLNDGKDDALATCRIFKDGNGDWYLGRVVVSKDARGMHLGSKMIKEVHEYLKEKDVNRLYCHAQMTAKPFYDHLGYQVKGDIFDEGGIEHVLMYKDL